MRIKMKGISSVVDWETLLQGKGFVKKSLPLFPHQEEALKRGHEHYTEHDRGQLIMACGTGKTFTALALMEQETQGQGLVLFLVPSISLLNQSLIAWMAQAKHPIYPICICSDPKTSRKRDELEQSVQELALPATTRPQVITERLAMYRQKPGLTVVFSTYQSIDAVAAAQEAAAAQLGQDASIFDWIICDEAHRTTGIQEKEIKDASSFTKIHLPDFIRGRKRLYMTATPRLYGENVKVKAQATETLLCSMDDTEIYGEEFYRVGFSYAVEHGLLTDYKVLILTVGKEADIPTDIRDLVHDPENKELNFDTASRLIGCINGLAKNILGDQGTTWAADSQIMRRAIAFCGNINKKDDPASSVNISQQLPVISASLSEVTKADTGRHPIRVEARHIDGSMNSDTRSKHLQWLKEESSDPEECRVLCNVRCLSEGIDVPALDAVIFLSPRNSQVDVVQSVGRVMRNFRKNSANEKRYGYIIIPIVVNHFTEWR